MSNTDAGPPMPDTATVDAPLLPALSAQPPTAAHHPARLREATRRIAALENELAQAHHLLIHDDLTPLLNRRGFVNACSQWSEKRHPREMACCALLDLDDFKAVNDRHGHPVGDAALLHFSRILLQHVRRIDALARLGGDEFALVLPNTRLTDAVAVVEHLRRVVLAAPLPCLETSLRIQFSAGVAEQQPGEVLSDTLARADFALLGAKKHGTKSCSRW